MTKNKGSRSQIGNKGSYVDYAEGLYKYWVDRYGYKHIDRWLKKHKYNTNSCETNEFVTYMIDCFFNWVDKED